MLQSRTIKVFCWILSVADRSFSVIDDNLTVHNLKAAIVKKNPVSFEGVDAYDLALWRVSGFPPFSTLTIFPQGVLCDRQTTRGQR
jgi:hypothetical protein